MNLATVLLGPDPGDRAALLAPDGTVLATAADLADQAHRVAGALAASTAPGDRVALAIANRPEFVVGYLATLLAGRIAVPVDPGAPAAERERHLAAVTPTVVLQADDLPALLAAGTPLTTAADVADDDVAVCLFTSGTAGAPRAARLTHGCLRANLEQVQSVPGLAVRPDDVVLGALPLFHVFGLNVVLGLALRAGAAITLVEQFHPVDTARQIADAKVSVAPGVPAMFDAWLAVADTIGPDAFASVRLAVSGAAALTPTTQDRFRETFGVTIHQGYGLTEASPIVSTTAVDRAVRPGSIGPALPGVEVRLVAADGTDALTDDPGEIWVRGPNVFAGYWNDPQRSAEVLDADGWLRTGDIAVADADGWLTLVDRSKDLIIVSGFNVYPAEVEGALVEHPDIAAAAVVGEPDERSGERVVAFVVVRSGAEEPTATQLISHLRRRVARYKIPVRFEIVETLPQTFAGKLLRRVLRDDATAKPA